MTTNNQTQSWTKITDGGVGKAHFSTYICDFIENKETIIGGKIVFRAGITRLNEVHVYVLSAQSINKDVINSLLMKNMLPFRKDYKKTATTTINGVKHTILILGYSESTFKALFSANKELNIPSNNSIFSEIT